MPRVVCPACRGYCRVHREQCGRKTACPRCGSKFTPALSLWRQASPFIIAVVVLSVVAVAIYLGYKAFQQAQA
jgi:hypothetical protein